MGKKNCTKCEHYREEKTPDKLHPDKSVTKGTITHKCNLGSFELKDFDPCELFEVPAPYYGCYY